MICENCGKEHDGTYGSGRFCCKECARSFSTKNETNNLKEVNCIDCGKSILVGKRSNPKTCRCKDCYRNYVLKSNLHILKTCKICGNKYISGEKCNNSFCNSHSLQGFELLEIFGFDKSKLGTIEVENEFNRIRQILFDLYWKDNLSSKEIANKYNFNSKHSIVQTVFKFLNIPKRNVSQSISNAFLTGRKNPSNSKKSI